MRNLRGGAVRGWWTGALCSVQNDNEMIGKGHRNFYLAAYHLLSRLFTAVAEWAHGEPSPCLGQAQLVEAHSDD